MARGIFVSYRRDDTAHVAGRIHDALTARFGRERIFMDVPRDELYARAELRFHQMIAAGALDEVRSLMDYDSDLPMMKAIGVPELMAHLNGEIDLDEAVIRAITATRNYIKRQLTWWRGQGADWQKGGMVEA